MKKSKYRIYGMNDKGWEFVTQLKREERILEATEIMKDIYKQYIIIEKKEDRDEIYGRGTFSNTKVLQRKKKLQ